MTWQRIFEALVFDVGGESLLGFAEHSHLRSCFRELGVFDGNVRLRYRPPWKCGPTAYL
jgi:hypothetical protein